MVIEARKLCGEHIGRLHKIKSYTQSNRNPQEFDIEWVNRPITMITHKKSGDVNVRVGQKDFRYRADSLVSLED